MSSPSLVDPLAHSLQSLTALQRDVGAMLHAQRMLFDSMKPLLSSEYHTHLSLRSSLGSLLEGNQFLQHRIDSFCESTHSLLSSVQEETLRNKQKSATEEEERVKTLKASSLTRETQGGSPVTTGTAETQRRMPSVVVLDGSIGVGKSSLIDFLQHDAELSERVIAFPEPLEYWEKLLPEYYADQQRLGLMVQNTVMFAHTLNFQKRLAEVLRLPDAASKLLLFERNPQSCNLFTQCMQLRDSEVSAIERLSKLLTDPGVFIIPQIDCQLYLRAEPERCLDRIRERSREGEELIPLEYLQKLHAAHDRYFEGFDPAKKLVVETSHRSKEQVHQHVKECLLAFLQEKDRRAC